MIEIKNLPSIEELAKGVRKIKVKVPNKKAALDKELLYMRVQQASYIDVNEVGNNDLAVIKISGKSDRYNKEQAEITVGLELYNSDIEKALLGMKIGESKSLITEAEEVSFTVKSIRRKVYSELSLDKIKAEDASINSIEEYEEKIYDDICNKMILEKSSKLQIDPMIDKLINQTQVDFELEDIDEELLKYLDSRFASLSDEEIMKQKREALKGGDYVLPYLKDGVSKEEFIESLNKEELDKFFDYGTKVDLGENLKKKAFCEENGIDLSKEAYEKFISESSIKYNMASETLKNQYPYFIFKHQSANKDARELLFDYLKKNYIEVVVE